MKKHNSHTPARRPVKRHADAEMLPEYDFTGGIRGKYVDRYVPGPAELVKRAEMVARLKPQIRQEWLAKLARAMADNPNWPRIRARIEQLWLAAARRDAARVKLFAARRQLAEAI